MTASLSLTKWGGTGKPLLLLHGLLGSGKEFKSIVPYLIGKYTVYTIDLPYHRGETQDTLPPSSATKTAELDFNYFIADVCEAAYQINQGPLIVLGLSLGGLISWCFAAKYPELVSKLIIEDMAPDLTKVRIKSGLTVIKRLFADHSELPYTEFKSHLNLLVGETTAEYFTTSFIQTTNQKGTIIVKPHGSLNDWQQIERYINQHQFWREWKQITHPSLILGATKTFVPPEQLQEMTVTNPQAIYYQVPNSTHLIHRSNPWGFRGAIEAFLQGN